MAKSRAMSAMMYNRWGDLYFILIIFGERELLISALLIAVCCKSSLYLCQYWLPVAMEGPTPVSSLLHSSTMVVARVFLAILAPVNGILVLVLVILGSNIVGHMDVKKNIAYSTSIHLIMMFVCVCCGLFSFVVVYILLHGMIKGQLFQASGYEIHGVGSQDMRKIGIVRSSMMMLFSMFVLSALVGLVMVGSKEVVVLGVVTLIMLCMVVVSMIYTVSYLNKMSVTGKVGEAEGSYVLLVILISMMVVDVNFGV